MNIDIVKIRAELQKLAGNCTLKVKTDTHMEATCSTRETDGGYFIRLNPRLIRTQNQLDYHLNCLRADITGFGG